MTVRLRLNWNANLYLLSAQNGYDSKIIRRRGSSKTILKLRKISPPINLQVGGGEIPALGLSKDCTRFAKFQVAYL